MKALRYLLHLSLATAVPMLLAVLLEMIFSVPMQLLGLHAKAVEWQSIVSSPPFPLHIAVALVLGTMVSFWTSQPKIGLWVWILPAVWMVVGLLTWRSGDNALNGIAVHNSVWQWFFSADWQKLQRSPFRAQWAVAQFSHTVPLYTSVAYSLGTAAAGIWKGRRDVVRLK